MSKKPKQLEIVRAVTNDPALAETTVQLGELTVKIVDLPYDDYCLFMAHLKPVLETVVGQIGSVIGMDAQTKFGVNELLEYCGDVVPHLALLSVKQTYPDITIAELKVQAKSPFKLASLVVKQIEQNHIIEEIGDFFVQILPFLPRKRTTAGLA